MAVERDDIDNVRVIGVGVIGALVVTALILFVQALFLRMERVDAESKQSTPIALQDYRSEQETQLSKYEWANQDQGTVRIPLDRAMQLTLHDLHKNRIEAPAPSVRKGR